MLCMMLYTLFGARKEFNYARHGRRTRAIFEKRSTLSRMAGQRASVEESRESACLPRPFSGTQTLSYTLQAIGIWMRSSPWMSPSTLRIASAVAAGGSELVLRRISYREDDRIAQSGSSVC